MKLSSLKMTEPAIDLGICLAIASSMKDIVIPDKLMAFTIPSFIYYLWSADAAEWFLGLSIPHPASLFNDGLSPERLCAALASYGVLFAVSLAAYYAGCERRLRHA